MRRVHTHDILQSIYLSMTQDDLFDIIAMLSRRDIDSKLYNHDLNSFAYYIINQIPHELDEILYDPDGDRNWFNQGLEDVLEEISLEMSDAEIADLIDCYFYYILNCDNCLIMHDGQKKALINADYIAKRISSYRSAVIRAI